MTPPSCASNAPPGSPVSDAKACTQPASVAHDDPRGIGGERGHLVASAHAPERLLRGDVNPHEPLAQREDHAPRIDRRQTPRGGRLRRRETNASRGAAVTHQRKGKRTVLRERDDVTGNDCHGNPRAATFHRNLPAWVHNSSDSVRATGDAVDRHGEGRDVAATIREHRGLSTHGLGVGRRKMRRSRDAHEPCAVEGKCLQRALRKRRFARAPAFGVVVPERPALLDRRTPLATNRKRDSSCRACSIALPAQTLTRHAGDLLLVLPLNIRQVEAASGREEGHGSPVRRACRIGVRALVLRQSLHVRAAADRR